MSTPQTSGQKVGGKDAVAGNTNSGATQDTLRTPTITPVKSDVRASPFIESVLNSTVKNLTSDENAKSSVAKPRSISAPRSTAVSLEYAEEVQKQSSSLGNLENPKGTVPGIPGGGTVPVRQGPPNIEAARGDKIVTMFDQLNPIRVRRMEGPDAIYTTYYQNKAMLTSSADPKATRPIDIYISQESLVYAHLGGEQYRVVEIDNFVSQQDGSKFTAQLDESFYWGTYHTGERYLVQHPAGTMMLQGCIAPTAAAKEVEQKLKAESNKALNKTQQEAYIKSIVEARGEPLQIFVNPSSMGPEATKAYQDAEKIFLQELMQGKTSKPLSEVLRVSPPRSSK